MNTWRGEYGKNAVAYSLKLRKKLEDSSFEYNIPLLTNMAYKIGRLVHSILSS